MARLSHRLPLVSALALIASAGLAQAADMPQPPSPMYSAVPVSNWSGFYAGSIVGYGWTDADVELPGSFSASGSFDGWSSGAVIGHNWQSGNWIYGLEGDITLHEIRGDVGTSPLSVDTLYSAHLRGRVGYDFGRFMPYIAGGFATNETYARVSGTTTGDNQRLHGWTVGAGVDIRLGETFIGPVMVRAEYLYEDFGDETFDLNGTAVQVGHGTHFARLGLISYFGGDSEPSLNNASFDWSGAYGGLMVGYGRHNVTTELAGVSDELEADGALGGIYTGRNFQFGNFVAGLEGSIALADITGSGIYPGGSDYDYRGNIQVDTRARLGYAFGRFLPFVSAGVSWTRSEQENALGPVPQKGRVPAVAWTVGAGMDYRLAERWSLRGEYLYGRDDDPTSSELVAGAEQELETHQVRFGAAYHF